MENGLVEVEGFTAFVASARCTKTELGDTISRLFHTIAESNPEAEMTGPPLIFYTLWEQDHCEIMAAMPVQANSEPQGSVQKREFPGQTTYMMNHWGAYDSLHETWEKLWLEVKNLGLTPSGDPPYDRYVTDPSHEANKERWLTELYVPVAITKI
ncbi:MAG: GyrI-like domain-containing protein [Fimbriimonadaceae bacterium]|jgi:effector-binding domain-containing protein|nr:GyrI-like domain-containing protein [Fimbriimonadaceae bacterium]